MGVQVVHCPRGPVTAKVQPSFYLPRHTWYEAMSTRRKEAFDCSQKAPSTSLALYPQGWALPRGHLFLILTEAPHGLART